MSSSPCSVTGITRDALLDQFARENIDTRSFFWPLSSLPMFEDMPKNKVAWDIPDRAVNLPSYYDLIDIEMDRVISQISTKFNL